MTNVVLIKLRIKRTLCVWHSSRGFRMEGANEDTGLWVLAQGELALVPIHPNDTMLWF